MLASLGLLAFSSTQSCMPLQYTICQCALGFAAFLGRSGICSFVPLEGDCDNTHAMMMQAAEELPVSHIILAVQVEQSLVLKDWDEGTLDDMGCYTSQGNIYQVRVMLLKLRWLSAAGLSFAQKLKSKTVSAIDAAEDPPCVT